MRVDMPSINRNTNKKYIRLGGRLFVTGLMFLLFCLPLPAQAKSRSDYLYNLSSFTGPVASLWSRLAVDEETGEIYSLNRHVSLIQIFNESSMLVHSFGEEYQLASAVDIAAGRNGGVYLIQATAAERQLMELDYKGALQKTVDLRNLPAAFLPFAPTRLEFRDGKLYLLDAEALKLVVLTADGGFLKGYRIRELLMDAAGDDERYQKELAGMDFNGFCVDARGAMYFTAPTSFSAYRMDSDGSIRGFGRSGSGPGTFGVVAGIDVDSQGTIYVTDRLRSVVIVFDRDFKFVREFGHRGGLPENLIAPDDVVIDERNGKLYVAQAANRGVSVFRLADQ